MRVLISLFFLTLLFSQTTAAQEKRLMLFSDYPRGTVLMKNKAKINTELNFDAANNNMMFRQDGKEMILTNFNEIDTIYINDKKFIVVKETYLEVVPTKHGTIYVHWNLKDVYQGQKGAFGITTQAKVESINTSEWQHGPYENQYVDIYQTANKNKYFLLREDKYVSINNEKTIFKSFPGHTAEIKSYLNQHKTDFSKTDEVIALLEYCMGL